MFLFSILIFIFILLISIDIYLKFKPCSKLKIIPIKYNLLEEKDSDKVICEFMVINLNSRKETMIPNFDIELDFFNNGLISKFPFETQIIIDDGYIKRNINNYWPTLIVKANSSISIRIEFRFNKFFISNEDFIWLKVNWTNYGHFGFINRQNCFLLNNKNNLTFQSQIIKIPDENEYEIIAIKTNILGVFDNPIETICKYCKDTIKQDDILILGETPLAIMQGRYINPKNIECSIFSYIFCYFFHPTSSLATSCGMQLLINKIGITRITYSLLLGAFFKLLGINGVFYRLAGIESSLIDDISGTTIPYDKSIVMGPKNTYKFCHEISKRLNIDSAIVDANDLGGVKIISSSSRQINKIIFKALKGNPSGNDDQKTPIVLIRRKHN